MPKTSRRTEGLSTASVYCAVMSDPLSWALAGARDHTLTLVADVPDENMRWQSTPGERHPAWLLGHLLLSDTYLLSLLTMRTLGDDFRALLRKYGPKAPPGQQEYDSKAELVQRLTETNSVRVAKVRGMTEKDLHRPMPDALLAPVQPTIGHHLHTLVFHEGYHAGQLSAWRKARGLAPVRWVFGPKS